MNWTLLLLYTTGMHLPALLCKTFAKTGAYVPLSASMWVQYTKFIIAKLYFIFIEWHEKCDMIADSSNFFHIYHQKPN